MILVKNTMVLATLVALLSVVTFAPGCANTQAQVSYWTKFSDMQLPPDIEPVSPWTAYALVWNHSVYTVYRGVLTIHTSGTNAVFFTHPDVRFDNRTGSTAEIKLRVLQGPASDHDASLFSLRDGRREGKISFFNDRIEVYDTNALRAVYKMDTTGDFHTYRLAIAGSNFEIFVDSAKIASITLINQVPEKMVLFGDISGRVAENLYALVDYIAYSTGGAMTPQGEAVISRTGPPAPVVAISPEFPQKGDDLVCRITAKTTDGRPASYTFAWYRDGALQPDLTTDTVDASKTDWGETWKCTIKFFGGDMDNYLGEDEVTIGATLWTKFSSMDVPPDDEEESPWKSSGTFETKVAIGGQLTVETRGTSIGYLSHPEVGFNNTTGSTAEIRLKLLRGPASNHDASLFSLQDGTREAKLSFFNNRVEVYDANTLRKVIGMDTTDDFHTYRLAVIGDTLDVFVDGETVASVLLQNKVSSRAVLFGDASAGVNENIVAYIDYLAYSVAGNNSSWTEEHPH